MSELRTLSEITTTCTKAVRGAGCPWGMAEEAGLAARLLSAHGLPGAEAVADLLATPRSCPCSNAEGAPACGLAEMVALLDAPPTTDLSLDDTAAPLLLLGFALAEGGYWDLRWPGGAARCGPAGVSLCGELPGPIARVDLARSIEAEDMRPADWRSRPVKEGAWGALEDLAAQLLVPETTQSRASGAGPDR